MIYSVPLFSINLPCVINKRIKDSSTDSILKFPKEINEIDEMQVFTSVLPIFFIIILILCIIDLYLYNEFILIFCKNVHQINRNSKNKGQWKSFFLLFSKNSMSFAIPPLWCTFNLNKETVILDRMV